jgi:hypothetical protein
MCLSSRPGRIAPSEGIPIPIERSLTGPQGRSGVCGKKQISYRKSNPDSSVIPPLDSLYFSNPVVQTQKSTTIFHWNYTRLHGIMTVIQYDAWKGPSHTWKDGLVSENKVAELSGRCLCNLFTFYEFVFLMFPSCCASIINNKNYVPLHVSTLIWLSSGVVIYTFSILNCKVCIHVYIHRLKVTTFYVHLYSNC